MRLALLILVFILQALQPVTAQQSSNVLVSSATNQAPAYGENAIIFFGTETMSLAEALARDTDLFNHPKNTTNDVIIFAYGAGRLTKRSERLDFFIYDTDKYLTALERVSLDLLSALEVVMSGDENQKSLSVMETSERAYRTAGHGEKLLKLTGEFNIYSNKPKIYFHARNVEIVE